MILIPNIGSGGTDQFVSPGSLNEGSVSAMVSSGNIIKCITLTGMEYDFTGQSEASIAIIIGGLMGTLGVSNVWRVGDTVYVKGNQTLGDFLGVTPIQRDVYKFN